MITYSIIFLLISAFIAPVKNIIKIIYVLLLSVFLYLFNLQIINHFLTQTAYATRNKAFCSFIFFDENQEGVVRNCNRKTKYAKYVKQDGCKDLDANECVYKIAEKKNGFRYMHEL
jgi:hypothetical protein